MERICEIRSSGFDYCRNHYLCIPRPRKSVSSAFSPSFEFDTYWSLLGRKKEHCSCCSNKTLFSSVAVCLNDTFDCKPIVCGHRNPDMFRSLDLYLEKDINAFTALICLRVVFLFTFVSKYD